MDKVILPVQERETMKARNLRKKQFIPAVYYGHGVDNKQLQIDYNTFHKVFKQAGYNTIIELELGEDKLMVLLQEVDTDPVSDRYAHIDFIAVKAGEKITTNIPLSFINQAPAVKELGGMLLRKKDEVEVRCLPKDLIHEIEVDLSVLTDFNIHISVADLKVPDTIEILDAEDIALCSVNAPKTEEELAAEEAADAAPVAAEGEGEGEGEEASEEGEKTEEDKESSEAKEE